jgi:arylsulfatase A-like enzyme/Tfp pilus assembly protein PilF
VSVILWALLAAAGAAPRTSVVLITLDTTRADALGCYGASRRTPTLDALAARGIRYSTALTASPLTLPAHSSLLTGLDPPEHGVTDNGTAVLAPDVPTLATVLSGRGYATAAFVGSRILDRRFGLAHGFATYDDRMAAELTGEYGYPERNAAAVTTAALGWLKTRPADRPFFLWAHYYDPHAPYEASGATPAERYAGEVATVDRELGRLLAALPAGSLVAAVGDHGESLGEHGERGHGIFLYDATLRVPLLIAGPGVPAGRVVDELVATRRLAPTLLRLLGEAGLRGTPFPGLGPAAPPEAVFSETHLPASAFGWSPLRALSESRWRFIEAPRSELYDVAADPGQTQERSAQESAQLARMRKQLGAYVDRLRVRSAKAPVPEAAEAVRSLGYLSGASGSRPGTIDPKDGIRLLAELDQAKAAMQAGRFAEALPRLRDLCTRSPGNIPFLSQLARAQEGSGDLKGAVATFLIARDANPRSEFTYLHLADAYRRLGQLDDSKHSYESALALNPRSGEAWLGLAEMAKEAGRADEEYDLLRRADEAGTASGSLLARLAQIEIARGLKDKADGHLEEATTLLPQWPTSWLIWAALAETQQRDADAITRYERASAADPKNPAPLLQLGRLHLKRGETARARQDLESAATLAPGSAAGREAQRLLATLKP